MVSRRQGEKTKKVVVTSVLGKRTFAGWLKNNDQETLDLITVFSQDFGTLAEVSYRNVDDGRQEDLREIMNAARDKAQANHMNDIREKLKQ